VANGRQALYSNSSGSQNTATGASALHNNTTGTSNTANGASALRSNSAGVSNTAVGGRALYRNNASYNTAVGQNAMDSTTTGYSNTAVGEKSLYSNTGGYLNVAVGGQSLYLNYSGYQNTAVGLNSLHQNVSGDGNTATGDHALYNATGNNNIAVGSSAGSGLTTGDNNIYLAAVGTSESNTIRIGRFGVQTRAFVQGVRGIATANANAIPVVVDSSGQLGTASSSARFKTAIQPMQEASEAILALKPVSFHYKSDKSGTPQFGLIAEQVAKVDPDLVVSDDKGEIYTVRYEAVNAMLLNEFLKEHQRVQELRASDTEQKKEIAELRSQLKEQGEAIRKVSERVDISASEQLIADQR